MQAVRRQAEDDVARPRGRPVEERGALHDPDAEPGQVEVVLAHQPRMLGRLAADEGASREPAAVGDAADQLGDLERVQPADGHIVEEVQRRGAGAHDVVGAHGDEVVADGVEPTHGIRDGGLRTYAVGRRHQHRLAIAGRHRERRSEPAEAAQDARAVGGRHCRSHQLDGAVPSLDVDAGLGVGRATHRTPVPAISSTNLRSPASYGTGSG
jgi:hypothetical protein